MPKFDFNNFPPHIVQNHIAPKLGNHDLNTATAVSKHWASTFGDKVVYTNKLLAEYGIKKEQYQDFSALANNGDYKLFYARFKRIKDKLEKSRSIYTSPQKLLSDPLFADSHLTPMLLMLSADDLNYFKNHFSHLNAKELAIVGEMAVHTDSRSIAYYCFDQINDKYALLNFTAEAGNLNYMKDLLARKHNVKVKDKLVSVNLTPGIMTMRKALTSGNEVMVKFLMKEYGFNPSEYKAWAAENGELKVLTFIRKMEQEEAEKLKESITKEEPIVSVTRPKR